MKRLAVILAAVIILIAGALLIAPLFIPADVARTQIAAQIEQWIGRPVSFSGEPAISFFPRPSVRLENVVIEDADGTGHVFISAEALTGTFRLLPLVVGRVEASAFELLRPTIALRVDEDGNSNWTFDGTLGDRVNEAQQEPAATNAPSEVALGRFRIVDGTITYDEPGAELAVLSEIDLDFVWPSTAVPATASGSLVWRGERVAVSASLTRPMELIAGRSSPGSFSVTGEPIRIEFGGSVGRNDLDFIFDGETEVTMGSLRRVVDWAGADIAEGPTLAGAAISGRARWEWPVLSFAGAEMRLDGNQATGAFTVDFSGEHVNIVGTLALAYLDLTPYSAAFLTDIQADGDWRNVAINLPVFDYVDADIRISAARVQIGETQLSDLAAAAIADKGEISLRVAQARFYGGQLTGSLTAHYEAPLFRAALDITLRDVEIRPALADLAGIAPVSGPITGVLALTAEGTSWGQLVHRMTGTLEASIAGGILYGVDLAAAATSPEPRIEDVTFGTGETGFDAVAAVFTVFGGQVIVEAIDIAAGDFDIAFTGFGGLLEPTVGGRGVVRFDGATDGAARTLPFMLTGTWLEPAFGTETQQ